MGPELLGVISRLQSLGLGPAVDLDSQGRPTLRVDLSPLQGSARAGPGGSQASPAPAPPARAASQPLAEAELSDWTVEGPDRSGPAAEGFRGRAAADSAASRPEPTEASHGRLAEVPAEAYASLGRLGPLGGLSARQRVERAYRLGASDGEVADSLEQGVRASQVSDRLQGQHSCIYVVLVPRGRGPPCCTSSASTYHDLTHVGVDWASETVSRSFGSRQEARAYCLGAGLSGLPRER